MSTELIKEVVFLLKHCLKFMHDTGERQYIKLNEKYNINVLKTETVYSYANIELDIEEKYTALHIIEGVNCNQDYRSQIDGDYLYVSSNFRENKIVYRDLFTHNVIEEYNYKITKDEYVVQMFNANLLHDAVTVLCLELAYEIPKSIERNEKMNFKHILKLSTDELEDIAFLLMKFIDENVPVKLEDL